jgi:hypothetical protein
VLHRLLNAAPPMLLTTVSLTTLLPTTMRVLILLYSTTLSLQMIVLNSLLSAAPATLLTTASLSTLLPMTMRVLILLYSTTLTIALSTNQMNGTVCQTTGSEHSSMRLLPSMEWSGIDTGTQTLTRTGCHAPHSQNCGCMFMNYDI